MEEQKIPSRSERHKKKKKGGLFFSSKKEDDKTEAHSIETAPKSAPAPVTGSEWYFSRPEPTGAPDETAEAHEAENREAVPQCATAVTDGSDDTQNSHDSKAASGKRKKRKQLNPAFGFLLLLVMLFSGAWCGYAAMNAVLPPADDYYSTHPDQEMVDNINILVLGCDEREGDTAARADVIMVATIRPEVKQVSIFSIPRDTRVAIEGHGQDKINHAMAYGGIPLVQSSVENLLDVQIDHYVKINFDGFINVIDALGGINIEVPCRMYKPLEAIDLLPGYQTLDGSEALAFVRWRGDGTGDYGRIERQQQFLGAVMDKVKDMSLKQALDVASAVMDSIETDMSIKQMTSYGVNLLGISSEAIHTYSFVGQELWLNGVNYVEPDMAAIAEIVDKMQHGEPEPEPAADGPSAEGQPADDASVPQ
ncbi:MAG: LCP family protein [Peptococcaceae bacterium]